MDAITYIRDDTEHLHSLYSQTCNYPGRNHTVNIEKERKIQDSPGFKYNLEYLIDHGHVLLDLVKNHEIFESSVSAGRKWLFI